ncbi:MAG: Nif11-like leader peptide family RiPP precursor [Actinobacteria bacterium]|nr:Nif11-like leader peptide family RiPP precursor [Actinomycetota bacterium]MCL5446980.1 Nif11-like leader peptide family RiPP precursor [Actinomycetota bacterium]
MTEETVRAFAERLTTDEEFARRLGSASSPDERLKMANDAGYDLSASDLSAIKTALSIEELSDEDLEKVAGGIGASASVGAATATAATAATAVATATAAVAFAAAMV